MRTPSSSFHPRRAARWGGRSWRPLCGIAALLAIGGSTAPAASYTSSDPAILADVAGGSNALEKSVGQPTAYKTDEPLSGGLGERALIGYAHHKANHDDDAKAVQLGVAEALEFVDKMQAGEFGDTRGDEVKGPYVAATSTLVLAEVDSKKYYPQLKFLESYFRKVRNPAGFYTYPGNSKGDVSQTQYAILALWTLDKVGVVIDYPGVVKTIDWLLRVQDKSGGWPYLGIIPNSNELTDQQGVTPCLAMAGGSAMMIAADILRSWGNRGAPDDPQVQDLPKAIRLDTGDKELENADAVRPTVDTDRLLASIQKCDAYLSKKSPDPAKEPSTWPYYQIYTLERYESFKEALKGEGGQVSPWYDFGVDFLKSKKSGDGWPQNTYTTEGVSTAFAVLFLIRSTQKAIESSVVGVARGGYGLPDDTTEISVDGGQVKGKKAATAVTDLLNILEEDGGSKLEGKSIPEDLQLDTDPEKRKVTLDRLTRLVRGSQSWQARRVAARVLGQSGEMDVAPALIYALTDNDRVVQRYARDGLRFISRRFEGFGMPDEPSEYQVREAVTTWRKWYLSMYPGYVFLEEL